jgi:hypothetical protein
VVVPPVDQHLYPVVGRVAIERHAHLQGLHKPSGAMLPAKCATDVPVRPSLFPAQPANSHAHTARCGCARIRSGCM